MEVLSLAGKLNSTVAVYFNSTGCGYKIEEYLNKIYPKIGPIFSAYKKWTSVNEAAIKKFCDRNSERFSALFLTRPPENLCSDQKIRYIINFDMPKGYKEYEHRCHILTNMGNDRQNVIINFVTTREDIQLANYVEKFARLALGKSLK